jgi:penicillin-binding protein 2
MTSFDDLKDLYEEKRSFVNRTLTAAVLCLLLAGLLLARLLDLQVIQHDYYTTRADDNRMRVVAMPPVRGLIYDRNGTLLAQNRPSYDLEVTREQVDNLDRLLTNLAPIMGLTSSDIARFKDRVRKTPRYRGVALRSNLSPEEVARFEVNRFAFKGVDITAGLSREYPLGAGASHLVGYVGGISETDYATLNERDYQGINQIGKLGVEKSHEDELRGTPGARIVEANAAGRPLRELEQRPGAPGRNLYLSLDAKLQQTAEAALGPLNGAVAAIDPQTGEVLALVSKPGFDPHLFTEGISTSDYRQLQNDQARPLYNRALQGTYPPGSTIKPFMSFAGLTEGEATPDTHVNCTGTYYLPNSSRKYRCHKRTGHGTLDMANALARSCDVFYYQLALGLGIDRIDDILGQFGFGKATGIDIPHERNGLLPNRDWKRRVRKEPWFPGETLNIGIGQGYWQVTPLQMAQATARLAMRGGGFAPHLLRAIEDPITGNITAVAPVSLPAIPGDAKDYETVATAMQMVTHEPGGTAYRIGKDAPYRIAAKTGTAQVAGLAQSEEVAPTFDSTPLHLRDHAWFIAFAPADKPRIAIAVFAEHAGHGGSVAGPVARQVMDQYLLGKVLYATPTLGATPDAAPETTGEGDFDGFVAPEDEAPSAATGATPAVPSASNAGSNAGGNSGTPSRPAGGVVVPTPLPVPASGTGVAPGPAGAATRAVPTLRIPAQKPVRTPGLNPADALDAPNPEAGFDQPSPPPPKRGDTPLMPEPEGDSTTP